MSNYFNSINIGLRGLKAQKKSLDVTSHNIANANTEGYSRQRAIHSTTEPYTVPGQGMPTGAGQIGTGVEIAEIKRIKDQFIEGQIWEKKQSQGYWDKRYQGLHRMELIFNEPSDNNLSAALDNFWQSLQDLSNNPEDIAVRETVKERANTLVDTFHSLDDQLYDYKKSLNRDVHTTIDEINSYARRIADLNAQIVHIKGADKNPNDLMDKRDKLIEKLNKKVNVQTNEGERGNINVSIGGVSLVANDGVNPLDTEIIEGKEYEDRVVFKDLNISKNRNLIQNGELKSLLEMRDNVLTDYRGKLDNIAKKFAKRFNDVHESGYTINGASGEEFFVSDTDTNQNDTIDENDITADSININGVIADDPNRIAAGSLSDNLEVVEIGDDSGYNGDEYRINIETNGDYTIENLSNPTVPDATGTITTPATINEFGLEFNVKDYGSAVISENPGSGGNAVRLSDTLKSDKIFDNEEATTMDKFESLISNLGVKGQRANQMVNNQDTLVNQLDNQRQSISGVSLDEEMANMIKYQQAYSAAAKVISNSNRMLDSLMSIIR